MVLITINDVYTFAESMSKNTRFDSISNNIIINICNRINTKANANTEDIHNTLTLGLIGMSTVTHMDSHCQINTILLM